MAPNRNTGIQSKRSTLSLAKTTSGSFGGDPSQETARAGGAEAIGSATCGRISVSGGRKSEGRTVLVCGARIRGSAADYAARRTYR